MRGSSIFNSVVVSIGRYATTLISEFIVEIISKNEFIENYCSEMQRGHVFIVCSICPESVLIKSWNLYDLLQRGQDVIFGKDKDYFKNNLQLNYSGIGLEFSILCIKSLPHNHK